jgi:hypothetical protein
MLWYGITHLPRIEYRAVPDRYSVRQLDLHAIDPALTAAPEHSRSGSDFYPDADTRSALGVPPELREAMSSFLQNADGRQTLIQPDIQSHLALDDKFPLPTFLIWTPQRALERTIVPPPPSPEAAANAKPSLELPNDEIRLADTAIVSDKLARSTIAPPAATTSPLQLSWAKPVEMAPVTTSEPEERPSPAAVLSLFDMRMKMGLVSLPPVNEVASAAAPHPIVATPKDAGTASGTTRTKQTGPDAGKAPGENDPAEDAGLTTEHIVLPKNGRFGVVVVGDAVGQDYPEALAIWSSRVAYTAYLHVGLTRNWILQYSVLHSDEASVSGSLARLEAPWPYDIVRPNLISRNLNTDALMIHGVLTTGGRFESLAIAFPTRFRYASFVLQCLRQWQFRPARRNGQATAVEVLLIIPDELD